MTHCSVRATEQGVRGYLARFRSLSMKPPVAPRRPHVHTEHGVERPDPYHWMRDREDPELLPYIEDQVRTVPQRHLLGASLGGLFSGTLAWQAADLFSSVLSLSGAWTNVSNH